MTRNQIGLAIAVLCLGLLTTSCKQKDSTVEQKQASLQGMDSQPESEDETPSKAKPISEEVKTALDNATATAGITLLSAGQGEKRLYRYNLQEDSTEKAVMKMNMNMQSKVNGQLSPTPRMPTFVMPMIVSSKKREGDYLALEVRYEKIEVEDVNDTPPQVVDQIVQSLAYLQDILITWELDNRGQMQNLEYQELAEIPAHARTMLNQIKDSFKNFFVFLPETEIGQNATWVFTIPGFSVGGVIQDLGMHYRVTKMDDTSITLDVTTLSAIHEQTLKDPSGVETTIFPAKSYNTGTIVVDTSTLVPVSNTYGESALNMSMTGGPLQDKTRQMETNTTLRVSVDRG